MDSLVLGDGQAKAAASVSFCNLALALIPNTSSQSCHVRVSAHPLLFSLFFLLFPTVPRRSTLFKCDSAVRYFINNCPFFLSFFSSPLAHQSAASLACDTCTLELNRILQFTKLTNAKLKTEKFTYFEKFQVRAKSIAFLQLFVVRLKFWLALTHWVNWTRSVVDLQNFDWIVLKILNNIPRVEITETRKKRSGQNDPVCIRRVIFRFYWPLIPPWPAVRLRTLTRYSQWLIFLFRQMFDDGLFKFVKNQPPCWGPPFSCWDPSETANKEISYRKCLFTLETTESRATIEKTIFFHFSPHFQSFPNKILRDDAELFFYYKIASPSKLQLINRLVYLSK